MAESKLSFKNLNIGRKFTVSFFLFLMVPLLVLFLWINSSVKDRMRQENCRTNLAVLKQTKTSVDDLLQNLTYVSLQVIGNEQMQELFSDPELPQKKREELTKQVKYDIGALLSSKEYISGLSVFGNEEIYIQFGKYLLSMPEQFLEEIEVQKGRIVWIPASVCEEYAFQRDRTYEIVMGRTINSHDIFEKPLAFEKINVEEEYLCSLYSGIAGSGTEKVFIMDSTGAVVSSTDKDMLGKNVSGEEFFQRITEQREGYFQINSGKDTVSFYCLSDPGWYVVKLDNTESLAGNGQPDTVIVACIVIALVFGVIFYRLQRRRIIRPLIQLAGDVENFHEGNYEIGTYSESKDEIGKLNDSFVSMSRYIKDLIEKVYKSQLREKEAQLKYLQSQINPHFLYNTLDSMRWMAVKQKQYELAEQIEALSNLFKHALNDGKEFTTVEKEVKHLNDYMTIQKNRFGDRLKIIISVEPEVREETVLNLILQPLVENAIVHGIENKLGEGRIRVAIGKKDGNLIYTVEDNGLGTDADTIRRRINNRSDAHNALALDNINQRVKCTYGQEYGIEFESEIGKGTKVTVRMPAGRGGENEIINCG